MNGIGTDQQTADFSKLERICGVAAARHEHGQRRDSARVRVGVDDSRASIENHDQGKRTMQDDADAFVYSRVQRGLDRQIAEHFVVRGNDAGRTRCRSKYGEARIVAADAFATGCPARVVDERYVAEILG